MFRVVSNSVVFSINLKSSTFFIKTKIKLRNFLYKPPMISTLQKLTCVPARWNLVTYAKKQIRLSFQRKILLWGLESNFSQGYNWSKVCGFIIRRKNYVFQYPWCTYVARNKVPPLERYFRPIVNEILIKACMYLRRYMSCIFSRWKSSKIGFINTAIKFIFLLIHFKTNHQNENDRINIWKKYKNQ